MSKKFESTSFADRPRSSGARGSVSGNHSSCSSNQNSDNDEDSDTRYNVTYKERRREAHTYAEQKRRDAIKIGYENLRTVIPTCQQSDTSSTNASKISKASILQKSIDYITYLAEHNKNQEDELDKMRRDVMALKIMKANYEHIVKTHKNATPTHQPQLPEEIKFRLFQQMMDNLFLSFDHSTSANNFAELSACVFSWLEEYCKPQNMRQLMLSSLHQVTNELQ